MDTRDFNLKVIWKNFCAGYCVAKFEKEKIYKAFWKRTDCVFKLKIKPFAIEDGHFLPNYVNISGSE